MTNDVEKERSNRQGHPITILTLVVLLLCSPCNVRNAIQQAIGTPQTQVLNKSKTVQPSPSCHAAQEHLTVHEGVEVAFEYTPVLPVTAALPMMTWNGQQQSSIYSPHNFGAVLTVPFYILYQNLRLHL